MPYLLSAVYAVTGRNFTAWRVVNCGITAGAVTTAAIISAQFAGMPAAVITAAILLQSRELTRYSGMFMTEPLATLMLALLAWTWVRNASDGWTVKRSIASGIAMGGLLAARTIFHSHDTGPVDSAGQRSVVRLEAGMEDKSNLPRRGDRRHQPVVDSQHRRARCVHAAGYAGRHQPAHGVRPTRATKSGHLGIESWRWLARDRRAEARHRHIGSDAREASTEADPQLDDGQSRTGASPDVAARVAGAEAGTRLLFAMAVACGRSSCGAHSVEVSRSHGCWC